MSRVVGSSSTSRIEGLMPVDSLASAPVSEQAGMVGGECIANSISKRGLLTLNEFSALHHSRHAGFLRCELARVIPRHLGIIPAGGVHDAGQINAAGRQIVRRSYPGRVYSQVISRPSKFCVDRKSTRLNSSHANISYAVF